jgi:hypothetical protein
MTDETTFNNGKSLDFDGAVTRVRTSPTVQGLDVRVEPRCFLLLRPDKDCRRAAEHGALVTVFPDGERRPSIWSDDFVREALRRLRGHEYDPSLDSLVVAGSVVPVVTVACAVTHEYGRPPRLLFFDAQRQGFVARG